MTTTADDNAAAAAAADNNMTPDQHANLTRLFTPHHVAFIGGRDAETALNACRDIGFGGAIWAVNRRRETLGGVRCYADVDDLPEAPDAVFLAVPPRDAVDVTARLVRRGGAGIVCYTAGFGAAFGAHSGEGGAADRPLVEAAGDLAVVGPNCYGFINYMDKVALWPFAHGGDFPGFGAAVITQSGMLASDITMNQRALPLAFMASVGNQSVLEIADYVAALCARDEVRAIGLHIEGLRDIPAFCHAARQALEYNKPIVALKTGTSEIGARLTMSHTGSLSGGNEMYQALFDRLGIISVSNAVQLIETLKFICVSGIPAGGKVMGFTCSGGGATLLADAARNSSLTFPEASPSAAAAMQKHLPEIAEVSNPLDYTTPIWGTPKVRKVFDAAFSDGYDAAVIVQDFPLPEVDISKPHYLSDSHAFVAATTAAGLPSAVCSTLPENIDAETREWLVASGVTPLQGIAEGVAAIAGAAQYARRRAFVLRQVSADLLAVKSGEGTPEDEWQSKIALREAGIKTPPSNLADAANAAEVAAQIGFPVALKRVARSIAHKTEIGAVALDLRDGEAVETAVRRMRETVAAAGVKSADDCYLIERMMPSPIAELLVAIRAVDGFGLVLTIAAGGVLTEMLDDAETLLLPVGDAEIIAALQRLKIARQLAGFRGKPAVDKPRLAAAISRLADYATARRDDFAELEINPLFVYADEVCAVDARLLLLGDSA